MKREQKILFVICLWTLSEASVINVEHFKIKPTEVLRSKTPFGDIKKFDIENLVKGYGYVFAKHSITTEDGYELEIHRISSTAENNAGNNPAVLIMHDVLGTSADFLISGPKNSLALQLADQGYDVWLGNNRGNTWSRSHQSLLTTEKKFWDFSYNELGVYDAPAMIDYILKETNQSDLSYVGLSQGATQFFVMLSEKPEYNDKIKIMVALAPMVYLKNMNHIILKIFADNYGLVEWAEKALNINEILSHDSLFSIVSGLCKDESKFQGICSFLMSIILGFDKEGARKEMLSHLLDVFPGGSSLKELKHYAQGISTGKFRKFNYGIINNYEIYKSGTPPEYDLSKTKVPVSLFYGQNDWLVNVKDEEQLKSELPNVVENQLVGNEHFNHGDFIFSGDASSVLNFYVINTLNKYNDKTPISTTASTTATTPTADPDTSSTTSIPTTTKNSPTSTTQETSTKHSSSCTIYPSSFVIFVHLFLTGLVGGMLRY